MVAEEGVPEKEGLGMGVGTAEPEILCPHCVYVCVRAFACVCVRVCVLPEEWQRGCRRCNVTTLSLGTAFTSLWGKSHVSDTSDLIHDQMAPIKAHVCLNTSMHVLQHVCVSVCLCMRSQTMGPAGCMLVV